MIVAHTCSHLSRPAISFFLWLSQNSALNTGLYAQGRANEMDPPISGKDEHTGSVDTAAKRDSHVFPGIQVRQQRALLILEP